jgi:cytidylate kinase
MTILITIALFFVVCIVYETLKDLHTRAKDRSDERIMARYLRQEEVRAHAYDLAAIERIRHTTTDELLRVAAEESGEVIEGTAVEVKR